MSVTFATGRMLDGVLGTAAGSLVRAKAPLRISFAGGGTDLPHFYEKYQGAVLSSTINRYAHVTIYPRADKQIEIRSLDLGRTVRYALNEQPVYDGVMDLAKAAIHRLGVSAGMDLDVGWRRPGEAGWVDRRL